MFIKSCVIRVDNYIRSIHLHIYSERHKLKLLSGTQKEKTLTIIGCWLQSFSWSMQLRTASRSSLTMTMWYSSNTGWQEREDNLTSLTLQKVPSNKYAEIIRRRSQITRDFLAWEACKKYFVPKQKRDIWLQRCWWQGIKCWECGIEEIRRKSPAWMKKGNLNHAKNYPIQSKKY